MERLTNPNELIDELSAQDIVDMSRQDVARLENDRKLRQELRRQQIIRGLR